MLSVRTRSNDVPTEEGNSSARADASICHVVTREAGVREWDEGRGGRGGGRGGRRAGRGRARRAGRGGVRRGGRRAGWGQRARNRR